MFLRDYIDRIFTESAKVLKKRNRLQANTFYEKERTAPFQTPNWTIRGHNGSLKNAIKNACSKIPSITPLRTTESSSRTHPTEANLREQRSSTQVSSETHTHPTETNLREQHSSTQVSSETHTHPTETILREQRSTTQESSGIRPTDTTRTHPTDTNLREPRSSTQESSEQQSTQESSEQQSTQESSDLQLSSQDPSDLPLIRRKLRNKSKKSRKL